MFRFLLLAGVLATSIGSAHAAPRCPSGQIYRVTKKVCVDKAAAVRDGVINSRQNVAKRTEPVTTTRAERRHLDRASTSRPYARKGALPDAVKPSNEATEIRSAYSQAPVAASAALATTSASVHAAPAGVLTSNTASPFGALSDPWTSGLTSALSQYRFSLPLTNEN